MSAPEHGGGKTSIDPALEAPDRHSVSQLNGCTFCPDMHSKEAKIAGEREPRLYHLAAARVPAVQPAPARKPRWPSPSADPDWRSRRKRRAVTRSVAEHFDVEISELNFAIVAINVPEPFGDHLRMAPGIAGRGFTG